ncbi:MAG: DUF4011 domain-containing protein [Kiritimatiellae bacterium]|nr:DUF4011 domain-containing protein [Kiritimatiellia bacterium]
MSDMNLDSSSQEADGFAKALEQARNELLDLSFRNRALSLRPDAKSSRTLKIVNELSAQVHDRLVDRSRSVAFTPMSGSASGDAQSEDEGDDDGQTAANGRHSDSQLQTTLPSDALAKRLVKMERDARTAIEEQGTNLLFLTLGQLEWYEDDHSDIPLHAPLLMVPVSLGRNAAASCFTYDHGDAGDADCQKQCHVSVHGLLSQRRRSPAAKSRATKERRFLLSECICLVSPCSIA